MEKKKNSALKGIAIIIAIPLVLLASLTYLFFFKVNVQTDDSCYLYIHTEDTYDDILEKLEETGTLNSRTTFEFAASLLDYPDHIKGGRYELTNGMSNLQLLRRLRNGQQAPIQVTFSNIRTEQVLAEKITEDLEMSADELLSFLHKQETLQLYGKTDENIITLFRPNTYEFYWNISPEKLVEKMNKEYDKFWNGNRERQLSDINLSKEEVMTLASIVEEETAKKDEKPMVAGLYLNRLEIGMKLQADPTIKFALQDFSLRRIYSYHIEQSADSPYNTYRHAGLPPGPIRIPSDNGIDAVLYHVHHNYIYMCAKEDFSGYHNFAESYSEHLDNAAKYRKALDERNIQ